MSSTPASPSPNARKAALAAIREVVRAANPSKRDLVQELIEERRLESQRD